MSRVCSARVARRAAPAQTSRPDRSHLARRRGAGRLESAQGTLWHRRGRRSDKNWQVDYSRSRCVATSPTARVCAHFDARCPTLAHIAFLRGSDENAFEIGGGVVSHTSGAHISSQPILLSVDDGGAPLPVFLVDTEGFSGIGGRTSRTYAPHTHARQTRARISCLALPCWLKASRTDCVAQRYEANLFGIISLMTSVLIFNTVSPPMI